VTRLLQVSDAHFGTERPQVVEALVSLSGRLAPQLLVLSGDLTQRARRSQFSAAAAFVRRLAIPRLLAIPGNHDLPLLDLVTRAVAPYREYLQAFGPELEPRFSAPDCLVLAVKTTRRYRHVDGEISPEQRERVARTLRAAGPEQTRLVVLHQPIAVPRLSELPNVVHGAEAAIHAWHDAGVDIILGGHIHLPFVLPLHELRQLSRPLWAVNAGTAVSSRIRHDAGNSVNVLDMVAPRRAELQQWHYSDTVGEFVLGTKLHLLNGDVGPLTA
jgi:3',5'-cyclic AMP phosphodiesterase CpdA